MRQLSTVIWVLVFVVGAFLLYRVKYEVQSLKNQIAEISRDLEAEKEALHVAAAEWAYLNRPERLKALASKYLSASEVTPAQIAGIETIPFPGQTQAAVTSVEGLKQAAMKISPETGEEQ